MTRILRAGLSDASAPGAPGESDDDGSESGARKAA